MKIIIAFINSQDKKLQDILQRTCLKDLQWNDNCIKLSLFRKIFLKLLVFIKDGTIAFAECN